MNTTNVRNEILDSINEVSNVTMESTIDVFSSLAASYDKAGMILEYSNSDDLDMFAIFQEAEAKEGDVATNADASGKKQSIGYKILMFIPNILKKLWQFIKDAWNGVIVPTASNATAKTKSLFEQLLGKDEAWVRANAGKLGLAGAALAGAIAFVAFMKKDAIKSALEKWFNSIKRFWISLKITPKIAFNGTSFTTNIKTEGLMNTIKKIFGAFKTASELTKFVQDNAASKNYKAINDSVQNLLKTIEEIKKLGETDPFILGSDVDLKGADLTKVIQEFIRISKDSMPAQDYNIDAEKIKAIFSDTTDTYVKDILSGIQKINPELTALFSVLQATSTLFNETNTYATQVFEFQEKVGEGGGEVTPKEDAKEEEKPAEEGESKEEEKSEEPKEESKSTEIKDEKTAEAVEAVKEEPSKENAAAAVEAIKENIGSTDTGGDSAKSNATVAIKDGLDKVGAYLAKQPEISQMEAEKIAALAITIDALSEALSTQKLDKAAIQKYVDKAKKAEQSVLNVSPMKTKGGEKVVRNTQRGSNIVTGAELMSICKQLPNNPVVKINEDSIVLKTKKGKEDERTGNITIPGLSKLGYGKKNFVHKSGKGNTWVIESADDIFDVFNIYLESVLMSCAEDAEDTSFVVEYADGEVETVSEVIFESYDEPVETMEESINNHWYR